MGELRSYCTICSKKSKKNKSQYEENWSRTFDRAPSVIYKSSIFPTVMFFVSEKIEF